jgi:hypothetical protein
VYSIFTWKIAVLFQCRLLEIIRGCVGNPCALRIRNTENDAFPLILILTRSRGTLELLEIIEGKSTPTEALSTLIQSHESFDDQRRRDADEEIVREQREELKRQQEYEYRRSLEADLEKERVRQDDERKQREEHDANQRAQQKRLVKNRIERFILHVQLFVLPLKSNNNKNVKHVYLMSRMK